MATPAPGPERLPAPAGNADEPDVTPTGSIRRSRVRTVVGVLFVLVVAGGIVWTVSRNSAAFVDTVRRVGVGGLCLSVLAGLIGVGATGFQWRAVLSGLEVRFPPADAFRVFFVSQLGKYVPGSVWPIVMQMEAGRRRGASRKTVLAANLITLVSSLAVGLVLAGCLLPFSSPEAVKRYWWALAMLPLAILLALPRSLPALLDRLLVLARRQPLGVTMAPTATLRAAGWSVVSWLGLGLQLFVLAGAVGRPSFGLLALCVGGMALAVSAGILFLPAPAGAGARELVLGVVLVEALTTGQAVAVVVASRVVLIAVDLLLAGLAVLGARMFRDHDLPDPNGRFPQG